MNYSKYDVLIKVAELGSLTKAAEAIGCSQSNVSHVLNALTVFGLMIVLSVAGGSVISATSPVSLVDGLFESVSALATVGLSTGATPALSTVAKFMIIVLMYFGRVGLLTICIGFLQEKRSVNKIKYAETSLLIG